MTVWDLETGQEIRHFTGHTNGVHSVQFAVGEGSTEVIGGMVEQIASL